MKAEFQTINKAIDFYRGNGDAQGLEFMEDLGRRGYGSFFYIPVTSEVVEEMRQRLADIGLCVVEVVPKYMNGLECMVFHEPLVVELMEYGKEPA